MKLRIGERHGLRTPAAECEHIDPAGAAALRSTYRTLRHAGLTPTAARSAINTAYAVGTVATLNRLDEWYNAAGRRANLRVVPS